MSQPAMAAAPQGRVPPNSLQAEKSVLGAMMLSRDAVAAAMEHLTSEDFYYEINRRIFEAMVHLVRHSQPVDFVTLTDQLEKAGTLEALGGYDYVTEINGFVPSAANVEEYIRIVADRSTLRRLIAAATGILEESFAASKEVDVILGQAENAIFSIAQSKRRTSFISIQDALDELLDKVQEMSENPEPVTGLKSGFTLLDQWTTGFKPSELILIAARPAMGKTAFELNIAQQAARVNPDSCIALFSLEMPYEQLVSRLVSSVGNLPLQNLRTGRLGDPDWTRLDNASATLYDTQIYIDDTPGVTVLEMRSKCQRLKMEHGLSLVCIDYLQLITGSGGNGRGSESRQQEVSEITRSLKLMARELDVPILLLSQLSRAPERRENHRPMLADLRDSGAIEQDADMVIFLYRESYYAMEKQDVDPSEITNEAEVIIAKNRNGPTGTVKLIWDAANASFRDNNHMGPPLPDL